MLQHKPLLDMQTENSILYFQYN